MKDAYIFFFRFFSTIGYYKIALDPEAFIICTKWNTRNEKGASPTAVCTSQADHSIPHVDTGLPGGSGSWSPPSEAQTNWRIENRESLRTAGETKAAHLEEGDLQILETLPLVAMGLHHKAEIPSGQTGKGERASRAWAWACPWETRRAVDTHHEDARTGGFLQTLHPATPRAKLINTSGSCSAATGLCQAARVPSALSKAPQPGPSLLPEWRQFQPNLSAWLGFFSLPTVCQWLQNYIFCFIRLWQTASKVMKKKNKQTSKQTATTLLIFS